MAQVTEIVIVVKGDDKQLDSTIKKLEKLGVVDKKNAKSFEETGQKFKKSTKKMETEASKLDDTLKKVGNRIIAAFAVEKIISFTTEAVQLAAQLQGVQQAFDNLNSPGLLKNLREATKGTISDLELMKKAVQAKNLGIPIKQLGTLFEFARRRAKQTGESVEFLTQSIVTGIGRKSPLILDNLGIQVARVNAEFKKTGNFAQAAANIVNEEMAGMGEDILTTSEKIEQQSASWDNVKTQVGILLAPVVDAFLETSIAQLNTMNKSLSDETIPAWQRWSEAILVLQSGGKLVVDTLQAIRKETSELTDKELKEFFASMVESQTVIEETTNNLRGLQVELKALQDIQQNATIGSDKFNSAQKEIAKVELEIATALGKETDAQKEAKAEREKAGKEREKEEKRLFDSFTKGQEDLDKLFLRERKARADLAAVVAVTEAEKIAAVRTRVAEEVLTVGLGENEKALLVAKGEKEIADIRKKFADERQTKIDKGNAKVEEKEKESIRRKIEIANMSVDFISNLNQIATNKELQRILNKETAIKKQLDSELENTKLTEAQKSDLQEEANEKLRELKKERAEADKKQAKFNVVLSTAQGIVAALASVPPNVALSIAIAAIGVTELAIISSEPVPEFAEGTKKVKGGKKGKDSVLSWLMPDEAVVPVDKNTRYSGAVSDIIDGTFHKNYMHKDEVMEIENSFAQNVANSTYFNDENLLFAMQQGRRQDKKLTTALASVLVNAIEKANRPRFRY